MQDVLSTLLKHGGSLIRLFKLYDAQNCFKNGLELSVFKSSRTIKLSYFEKQKLFFLPVQYRWSAIKSVFALCEHRRVSRYFR